MGNQQAGGAGGGGLPPGFPGGPGQGGANKKDQKDKKKKRFESQGGPSRVGKKRVKKGPAPVVRLPKIYPSASVNYVY